MSVAPLVEQHETEITKFYVRPPMMAYKKPNAFGQKRQSEEKMPEEKTVIRSYGELLFNGNDPYKRIYVTADAGMGKTTFAKMLAVTWCEAHNPQDRLIRGTLDSHDIETVKKFDFLFLIKLRNFETSSKCSLDKMIRATIKSKLQHQSRYTKKFLEKVLCNKRCLILVDGLDEWIHPETCRTGEVIPHRRDWPKCTVLTTTRPWKLSTARLSIADIDRQVEISQLDQYTALELESRAIEFLNENQRQNGQVATDSYAKTVTGFEHSLPPEIRVHIIYIPFVLLQMICLWFRDKPIGKSLCQVYSDIIELNLTRWLVKTNLGHIMCKCEPSEEYANIKLKCMKGNLHCQRYMPLLLKIGKLAFLTLFNVYRKKLLKFDWRRARKYLSEEELKQCLYMGLLSQVKDTTSLTEERIQLYFPHETLHEFLCALFIATHWNNSDTGTMSIKRAISDKCISVSDILEMSDVFVFVCGLNPVVYSHISRQLVTIVDTNESYRNSNRSIGNTRLLKNYQHMQISCFVESTRNQHPECKIVIQDVVVTRQSYDKMKEDERRALEEILSNSASSMKSLVLESAGRIGRILEQAECPCLQSLSVAGCEPSLIPCVLTTAAQTLTYLRLVDVSLRDDSCSPISRMTKLQCLCLDNVDISRDSLNAVGDCIRDCISLQQLVLCFRNEVFAADKKPEQSGTSMNTLLRSTETKTMYTNLPLTHGRKKYVLDLSKHDKLQELNLRFSLTELHVNTEQLITCDVNWMYEFSVPAVSSLLAELHGAPVLKSLSLRGIRNSPPKIDITALPLLIKFNLLGCDLRDSTVTLTLLQLTEFTLRDCDLRDSTVILTLPRLKEFILDGCNLRDSTVNLTVPLLTEFTLAKCDLRDITITLSPEMTSLKTVTLERTTVNIPCYRELFLSISKLPQHTTVKLESIYITEEEWRELLFHVLGTLPKSIYVEVGWCMGLPWNEWRNIFDYVNASRAFCVISSGWDLFEADIAFVTVVV